MCSAADFRDFGRVALVAANFRIFGRVALVAADFRNFGRAAPHGTKFRNSRRIFAFRRPRSKIEKFSSDFCLSAPTEQN